MDWTLSKLAKSLSLFPFLVALCSANAATFNEVGDAGNLPSTAQTTTNTNETFNEIRGALSPTTGDGEDLFKIFINGGGDFSAKTIGGVAFDSELFLLDASGHGVYSNDDTTGFLTPSFLPPNTALTPLTAGFYYLGITQCCDQPLSAGGAIFAGLDGGSSHLIVGGPTGAGGNSPITGYSHVFDQTPGGGPYTIFLTGAQLAPALPVPEPQTYALVLAGLLAMSFKARSGRRRVNFPGNAC